MVFAALFGAGPGAVAAVPSSAGASSVALAAAVSLASASAGEGEGLGEGLGEGEGTGEGEGDTPLRRSVGSCAVAEPAVVVGAIPTANGLSDDVYRYDRLNRPEACCCNGVTPSCDSQPPAAPHKRPDVTCVAW